MRGRSDLQNSSQHIVYSILQRNPNIGDRSHVCWALLEVMVPMDMLAQRYNDMSGNVDRWPKLKQNPWHTR
jgi:hypothetical protein